jgi:hypothetical protein
MAWDYLLELSKLMTIAGDLCDRGEVGSVEAEQLIRRTIPDKNIGIQESIILFSCLVGSTNNVHNAQDFSRGDMFIYQFGSRIQGSHRLRGIVLILS